LGLTSALAVAGASGLVLEANTNAKLRQEAARLTAENSAIPVLQSENLKLGRLAVEVEEMRRDDVEFVRLQAEAQRLKTRMQELARAEAARQPRSAKSGQVYEISALDQTPVARFQARPQYPFEMRRAGVSGEVVVDFLVDTNGEVQDAYALRSSQKDFEAAAVQAVSKWKFKPGRKGGRDVPTHMQVPIVFTLEGQTKPRPETQPSTGPGPSVERVDPSATVKLSTFDVVGTGSAATQPAGQPLAPRE